MVKKRLLLSVVTILLFAMATASAQGPYTAQIQNALRQFLGQPHAWFGGQAITIPVTSALPASQRAVDAQVQVTGVGNAPFLTVVRGEVGYASSVPFTGIARGLFGLAHASGTGNVATLTGAEGQAVLDATYTGGDVAAFGVRGVVTNSQTANAQITTGVGLYAEVTAVGTPNGQIATAIGVESNVNLAPTSAGHNAFGYYLLTANAGVNGSSIGYYIPSSALTGITKAAFQSDDATAPSIFTGGARASFFSNNTGAGTLASAATVAPVVGVNHITGAAAIVNITVPVTCSTGCMVNFIPDGAFTTTNAGNIGIASTATIGRVMTFVWDNTKWWPSY
jgi:hypothetical protein